MGWTVEDALGYRSRLIDGLDSIGERVDVIRQSPLSDLPTAIERLERVLEVVRDGMPCEQGVMDYGSDHDECVDQDQVALYTWQDPSEIDLVSRDDVLLTHDDDPTDVGLLSQSDLADWLDRMGTLPAIDLASTLADAIYQASQGFFRP